jgi:flagellar biosynthetic protein FlhB
VELVTLKPLVPKASRISPASGFQRLFGLRGLMRFVFSLLKLSIVVTVAWFLISDVIFAHLTLSRDLAQRFVGESWILWILAMILAGCLMAIGIFDMLYQRFQHHKDLMMTKQEIKEEFKQSEGDPLVKAKVRQIQRQMAQQRMMQEVPGADVVITNPTHVAVALKYDAKTMAAPVVVAKGYDAVAQRIKKLAAEHGVVMVENVPLARSLAKKVEIGHPIPTDFFQAVAEVLSTVYRLKGIDPGSGRAA